MTDLLVDRDALEVRARVLREVRDALEAAGRHLRGAGGEGLGEPGLVAALDGFAAAWGEGQRVLGGAADAAAGDLLGAVQALLGVDRALAGP